jgi:hypothetical protein
VSAAITRLGPANQAVSSTDQTNPSVMDTIALSPGSYVITASGWAQGTGPGTDTIQCAIDTGAGDQSMGETLGSTEQGSVALTLPVTITATSTFRFNCYRLDANGMNLIRSQLTAVKVGTVTSQ